MAVQEVLLPRELIWFKGAVVELSRGWEVRAGETVGMRSLVYIEEEYKEICISLYSSPCGQIGMN